jgi:hypothetical protein
MATEARLRPRLNGERRFYAGMGVAILLVVIVGFAPSYYLRGIVDAGRPLAPMTPLVHLHGALFSAYVGLFLVQAALISARRPLLHMKLGTLTVLLAAAMVAVGTMTAVQQAARGSGPPGIPPLVFLAVPLIAIFVFAGLVAAGWHCRSDPQTHKRLMLVAAVQMLQPAVGRLPLPPDVLGGELGTLVAFLMVTPLIVWDLARRGRLHKATAIGVAILAGEQLFRIAVWRTQAWQGFAGWIVGWLG